MAKTHLTKRVIDSLPKPMNRNGKRYYDTELACFGLIAYPSGRKSFFVEYGPRGKRKVHVLGPYGPLTLEDARKMGKMALAEALKGVDPNDDRATERVRREYTLAQWMDEYWKIIEGRKKYIKGDRRFLKLSKQRLGSKPLAGLTVDNIESVYQDIARNGTVKGVVRATPIQANRWLASIRACLQEAWRQGKITQNPAMRISKKFKENPGRTRVLSNDELERLLETVALYPEPHIRAGFYLLIETGARLSEVLKARWEDIDLGQALWKIPRPKSGKVEVIPLAETTVSMLKCLANQTPFIVPGASADQPRYDLKRPWERIKTDAKLKDVVIHDIRRTFGLHVARRSGLHIASRLLRHSDIRVTQRHYAPLGIDELRSALETRTADVIQMSMVSFRRKD